MFWNRKKKTFDTHCVIPTGGGILTMNQATYDYIHELERKIEEMKNMLAEKNKEK